MSTKNCPLKRVESYGNVKFGFCEKHECGFFNSFLKECGFASLGAIGFAIMKQKGDEKDVVQYSKD